MTMTVLVLMPWSRPTAAFPDLDALVRHVQAAHPGCTVAPGERKVRASGGPRTETFITVSGPKETVPGLGEFTGSRSLEYVTVPMVTR
ncbi:hypothetical protein [Deinococcus sp. 12RED42]|uniref:hypothetical protein n=1 Tax=Deinococcus sp. 12RED42 TaxID=2745872 RepID=UPI001E462330|nr:hypothetical protein [Deinococcus sp. 12RED42]MCD0167899.1 hypothetical protein [Deinococcus sp. 12RED42]